jgi:hypothetical protein
MAWTAAESHNDAANPAPHVVIIGGGMTAQEHCSLGSGSIGPAADGNTSIVAVYIQLGTVGLAASAFSLGSITNPAGVTPAFVSTATCPACFAEPQPGVYRLAVRPSFGNWGGGSYVVLLTVTKPAGTTVEIVVPIDIPF